MKILQLLLVSLLVYTSPAYTQSIDSIIKAADVERIERTLSSDDMKGRKAFTSSSEKAAAFISDEFKKIGLAPLTGNKDYLQTFTMVSTKLTSVKATIDGESLDSKSIISFSTKPTLQISEKSGFSKVYLKPGVDIRREIGKYLQPKENLLVFVDPSFADIFGRLARMSQPRFKSETSVVFILGSFPANAYNISINQQLTEQTGANVVGVLPGKSKTGELVIFSGHYDHLGVGNATNNDSIYNGANDDASGITAVIEIAKYYKTANNNERTLVFAAFTAEEIGGFGSQYFSRQIDAQKAVAMFNIEMIGTESKWGKNSAYITGFDKTDLGSILQNNLKGSNFSFYPDPYISENLFYRSDNATLARLGVPAHTISTSKMDNEANYHTVGDEINTLDIANMTEIIKSVIVSAKSIVAAKETPSRVKADELTR